MHRPQTEGWCWLRRQMPHWSCQWMMDTREERSNLQMKVGIDEVVETLEENDIDAKSNKNSGGYWGHPVDVFCESGPAKPAILVSSIPFLFGAEDSPE